MLSKMGRPAATVFFPAALALVLSTGLTHAQPGGCGQQQNRSRQRGLSRQSSLQGQLPLQQNVLQGQLPLQQNGLQAQLPLPQDPALVALQQQQNVLLVALQQQNAQLVALQQQNALLVAQQRRQQQQNAVLMAQQLQQAQANGPAAQPRGAQDAGGGAAADRPEDPEAAAARKLQIARDLVADAGKAQFEGEENRAARMRGRAAERLRDVVAQYPGTRAADRAQEMLDRLGL
jgi:hypothetical protein